MEAVDRRLNNGDKVTLGDNVIESQVTTNRGGLNLIALYDGDEREYVIISNRFEHGETVEVPEGGQILAVAEGSGMSNPIVWTLFPTDVYGNSGDTE